MAFWIPERALEKRARPSSMWGLLGRDEVQDFRMTSPLSSILHGRPEPTRSSHGDRDPWGYAGVVPSRVYSGPPAPISGTAAYTAGTTRVHDREWLQPVLTATIRGPFLEHRPSRYGRAARPHAGIPLILW